MYSSDDAAHVVARLPQVMQAAEDARVRRVHPSMQDRRRAMDVVIQVMGSRRRKVYGGAAINLHLSCAGVSLLNDTTEVADIEFYTPDPIADMTAVCIALHDAHGFRNVQGREVAHRETFGISVEYTRLCDLTYVPPGVYPHIPATLSSATGLVYCCPTFLFIDLLRIVSEPDTSYWRLNKAFPRLVLLDRCFPLLAPDGVPVPQQLEEDAVRKAARKLADMCLSEFMPGRQSLVLIGRVAVDFYEAFATGTVEETPAPGHMPDLEMISVDFDADVAQFLLWVEAAKVADALVSVATGAGVTVQQHRQFCDLLGRSVRIVLGGNALVPGTATPVVIYDSMHRGLPFVNDFAGGLRVGSVHLVAANIASAQFRAHVEDCRRGGRSFTSAAYSAPLLRLFAARNCFFAAHEALSILDGDHPFRDLFPGSAAGDEDDDAGAQSRGVAGVTKSAMHVHAMVNSFKHHRFGQTPSWYTFDPSRQRDRTRAGPAFRFLDTSGDRVVVRHHRKRS